MKKNKVFFGLALLGIAFSGAAFTANETLLAPHFVQKPNECAQTIDTQCESIPTTQCEALDPMDPSSGLWPVYERALNAEECTQPLYERR